MGITSLSAPEALLVSVSGFFIVFGMLAALSLMIVLISRAAGSLARRPAPVGSPAPVPAPAARPAMPPAAPIMAAASTAQTAPFGGTVTLSGVDDLTAACIMAIVSDEIGVPLSELTFKSIKAI